MSSVELYSNYSNLAYSVIVQAFRDYVLAQRFIKKHNKKRLYNDTIKLQAQLAAMDAKSPEYKNLRGKYYTAKNKVYSYLQAEETVENTPQYFQSSYLRTYIDLLGLEFNVDEVLEKLVRNDNMRRTLSNG